MRWRAWVAFGIAVVALRASAEKPKAPQKTGAEASAAEAALTRDEAAALSIWVDEDVDVSGKGANRFDDGYVENVRGRIAGLFVQAGAKVVSSSEAKHDVVARLALVDLVRHSGLFKDYETGTLSVELTGDGRLLAEVRRKFESRDAIEGEIKAAVEELLAAPTLVAYAREKARSRSPVATGAAGGKGAGAKRVAVLEFRGPLPAAILTGIADETRGATAETLRPKGVAVMTRESMAMVLKDMGKDAAVACSEGECEVETGRMIGADLVVTGEVIKVDKLFVLILKLHETAGGSLVATRQARGKDALEIMDAVKPAAIALFR